MKRYIYFVASLLLILASCKGGDKKQQETANEGEDKVESKVIRKHLPIITEFSYITSISGMNVIFSQGDYNLEVEGDSLLVQYLVTDFESNLLTLSIASETNADINLYERKQAVTVYVSCPDIRCISLCSSGDLTISGTVRTPDLQMGSMGKGTFTCDSIYAKHFMFESSQNGHADLKYVESDLMYLNNIRTGTITANVKADTLNVTNVSDGLMTISGTAKHKSVTNSKQGVVNTDILTKAN